MKINAGIAGATGYSGEVLVEMLLKHPDVRIAGLYASIDKPKISDIFPKFKKRIDLECKKISASDMADKCDLVFLALPHTVSMEIAPKILSCGKKVIDLSADYRLKNTSVYEKFYKVKHKDKSGLKEAVYGLPELYRQKIKKASLIANPGCYPTAAILGLAPALAVNLINSSSIIIDAKSGVTGAGRKLAEASLFSEINEDFKAYKVNNHQHQPEINQELSKISGDKIEVTFVPHLLPLSRGILETIYINKAQNSKLKVHGLIDLYSKFYKSEPFVRIKEEGIFPRLKDVAGTNFCDIGVKDCGDKIIIIVAIDNLLKGASGQAIQNMNIMYGLPEHTALI
ncbi:MAG: N-acetyl-gamma-glutamyl-phosphate reductase [Candidatus Omnitrophota bacterium]|nr:N-acetyl-gamma-glutamyl-phosphate reductase [Candidatus Omnitrophota bacterium]MBU1929423.1 N-acetyl-gamma-glutamyl-phosphate reductase [Candidatus Omnitrophota bacterium]MBU2034892.1 N-acetyl-gamma-glutamyl-phosphate reductase [Candidatus Omnitrophota bacterium]MBU2221618.1 N-acetyl-gamma-glutamyl-phosphate reductase [Candidatus Omnitrophota bacterium]MBU2258664.1 N-acetyl-gamma-glutamyl-phosphate reductase [Candidatus Omnitrophota bacterium]